MVVVQDIGTVLSNISLQITSFLPNLVVAIILLAIGLVAGKIIGRIVREVLDRIRLDYYVTESEKPVFSLSTLFALITRWWIYIAFITSAIGFLQIAELTVWMRTILGFIPNVIGAAIVVVVGYLLAEYIRGVLRKTGKLYAAIVGRVLFFLIVYVSIAIALPILNLPATLISSILLIIIGSLGLGMAIALGLGLKDPISDLAKRYVKKIKV
jgi:hypothetical protein